MKKEEKKKLLDELKKEMLQDTTLPLRSGATNLVFGEGNPDSKILFIGEGPGYWEDVKGRPFVGNAGALLNQLLYSIKLPREEVFITNVVNYRPPENRDPLPEEISAFERYLNKMIKIINPKMIVTLGRYSMGKFITNAKISSVHGRQHVVDWEGKTITVIPMYHPAAGLRNSEVKRQLGVDFQKIPQILEEASQKIEVEQMNLV